MSRIRQAVLYSFALRYAIQILALASTMLIARLLTPDEIGTFAIASSILMIISEFRQLGAGTYLVREKEIPRSKIRSALGLTFVMSWGAGILIIASAYWVAQYYRIPAIADIFLILSVSFFIAPYISIPTALLQRDYHFKTLFNISLISAFLGTIITVVLILLEYSYYGLAIGQTSKVLLELILVIYYWPKNMPVVPSFKNLGMVARVGAFTSLVSFLRNAHLTAPDMLLGKLGNSVQVALFSRSIGLVEFLSQTVMAGVTPIALPYLSQIRHAGGDISGAYVRVSLLIGGIVCPVLAVVGVASHPTIHFFFGDQWLAAAPLASLLALWGIIRCMHWLSMPLLIAQGYERALLAREVLLLAVLFAVFWFLYGFGLEAIAAGVVGLSFIDYLSSAVLLKLAIKLSFLEYLKSWVGTLAVTLLCGLATFFIGYVIDFQMPEFWWPLIVIALVLPFIWVALLILFKHPLVEEFKGMLPEKLRKKAPFVYLFMD